MTKRIRDRMRLEMGLRIHTRSPATYANKYPALAKRRAAVAPPARPRDFTEILIGKDPSGRPVSLPEAARMMHVHCCGASGFGKSTALKAMALADFRRGRGGVVFDPWGSHPDSLYNELIIELERDGFFKTGRVHVIDPNLVTDGYITPIDFLRPCPGVAHSVVADALLQGFEKVWNNEDSKSTPTVRNVLKTVFIALSEMGMPLSDAGLLFQPDDTSGLRARTITLLTDEYARTSLDRLHTMSINDRSKRDFNATTVGPINRLAEFASSKTIRAMCGVTDQPGTPRVTLDILGGMERGDIFLINLQHGDAVSEADSNLLGAMLLRYIFFCATRRKNLEPFFVYVDECHRYLTGDVPNILAEIRKFKVGVTLAHQFFAQLGKPGDLMYEACQNSTEIKIFFKMHSPEEAQRAAEMVLPFNLERPNRTSIRPTVIGQRRTRLSSRGTSTQESTSEGEAETTTEGYATSEGYAHGHSVGTSSSTTSGTGEFSAEGTNTGSVSSPTASLFGPNAPDASFMPYELSSSDGESNSTGSSETSSTTTATSESETSTRSFSETRSHARGSTTSRSRGRGTSSSVGEQEGFENIFADLATSYHSIESERYRAGEVIRALPIGKAFVRCANKTILVSITPPKRNNS